MAWAVAVCLLLTAPLPAGAAEFFVTEASTADGDGSAQKPWRLQIALDHPSPVQPGDTIWLRAGTYRGGYTSKLTGTEGRPIRISAAAGEDVIIDCTPRDAKDTGLFSLNGNWSELRDIEFTCSDPKRTTEIKGSWPADIRRGGVFSRGSHNKLINLIIHDTGGIGFWGTDEDGEGGEIYGCILYHNGWRGPDRGHGHGIYSQNARGTKRIENNVIFNQFGQGIHCYGSEKARLSGFHVEGNTAFNNGCLVEPTRRDGGLLIGGSTPVDRTTIVANLLYGNGFQVGYAGDVVNRGVVIRDNCITGSGLRFVGTADLTFTDNKIIAPGSMVFVDLGAEGTWRHTWDRNHYVRTKVEFAMFHVTEPSKKSAALGFAEWQQRTGFDGASSYREAPAEGTQVVVLPNRHEPGRGHIIVYNWDRAAAVEADLDRVLKPGQRFAIHSVQNLRGPPVLEGVYEDRSVRLPMKPAGHAQPVGMADYALPVTEPEFGAYLVRAK
jgi:hypothetical protein